MDLESEFALFEQELGELGDIPVPPPPPPPPPAAVEGLEKKTPEEEEKKEKKKKNQQEKEEEMDKKKRKRDYYESFSSSSFVGVGGSSGHAVISAAPARLMNTKEGGDGRTTWGEEGGGGGGVNPNRNNNSYNYNNNNNNSQNQNSSYNNSYKGRGVGFSNYDYIGNQQQRGVDSHDTQRVEGSGEVNPSKKKKLKGESGAGNAPKKIVRAAAGEIWEDPTLLEWNPDDYRIFVGDLGNDVTDAMLTNAFSHYGTFQKARVVFDKRSGKPRGYGFVSFSDSGDYVRAMREMNGKYVGNRPVKLRKSNWKDRNLATQRQKQREKKQLLAKFR
eukprot:Nk52_evm1s387 gene=Nk52_evmTU1s387